ncbi:MAG: CHAD domain-containing protein [Anaerolineae bacterium]
MEEYTAQLEAQLQPVEVHDSMAEAGRKILLADFIRMLKHEHGARLGDDAEEVHDMRVATRRMRSAVRLFEGYYKPKWIYYYNRRLRKIARALGAVRDLDVLIEGVEQYAASLTLPKRGSHRKMSDEEKNEREALQATLTAQHEALTEALALVRAQREGAREELLELFNSKGYNRFVGEFGTFLTTAGQGAAKDAGYPVGLMVPGIIYERLTAVRIHDHDVEVHTVESLHALRVEFKRLRYTAAFFVDINGKEADDFIDELKKVQDHLGRLNDAVVAQAINGGTGRRSG